MYFRISLHFPKKKTTTVAAASTLSPPQNQAHLVQHQRLHNIIDHRNQLNPTEIPYHSKKKSMLPNQTGQKTQ